MATSKEMFVVEKSVPSDLVSLKNKLLLPLGGKLPNLDEDSIRVERVFPGTLKHEAAVDIVNYSYNDMYGIDGKIIDVARDRLNELDTTISVVATQRFNGRPMVLGSLRFTCGKLDLFNLFEMEDGKKWPHMLDEVSKKSGEIGKFSFHPILSEHDLGYSNEERTKFKIIITRGLYQEGMRQMREVGVKVPYFIVSKHVLRFAESVGVSPCIKVEGAKLSKSQEARKMMEQFPKYWHSNEDVKYQPAVYIVPWEMQQIKI
jgi:hypothetical protein